MKKFNILKSLAVLALAFSCTPQEFEEITSLELKRCLEPQNLSLKIDPATGEDAIFSWDVNKDADAYNLVIYTDEAMTAKAKDLEVLAAEVPYTIHLTADQEYWFKVRAYRLEEPDAETGVALAKEDTYSNWAVYDGSEKTYAVKDNLFMEVTARTANSVSFAWSKDVTDYKDVTKIVASPVKGGDKVTKDLSAAEINAAAATVDGLAASTEYQFVLYYMSASRGAVDTWTLAEAGSKTVITNEAELKAAVLGGDYYLSYSDAPISMGTAKPTGSLSIVGELGPNGEKPTVVGMIELAAGLADNATLHFENIKFDGNAGSRIVNHTGGALNVASIKFVNCEITNFLAGFFYGNANDLIKIGEFTFDTCDMYGIPGSGGDAFDIRKTSEVETVRFVNNTMQDGIRTLFRIDASDEIKIGTIDFENNTVKNIATIDDGNNRGIFAVRVAHNMILKSNIFLWEDGGKAADSADADKAQLFQNNAGTVEPTFTAAENNYSYANGKDFFTKISAQVAGVKVLNEDPCYNSKGNFFQLANEDLIKAKAGASKWWISYVEKTEDLTQNVLAGAHTWNLQDATLFAGEVKNSRVRDELLLVGTEATPLNADGAINFLGASALTRKGVPTEGYAAFKVNTPGSVDLELANGGASSIVVALQDDNGFNVIGGAMATSNAGVQKVVIPAVSGEGMVYLYSTGAISLKKLAWSLDVLAGNKVLATPKPVAEPVTLTEGDATEVVFTWEAIDNAANYVPVFNKKSYPAQTELSFTVAAEDIATLKAGLYGFSVQAKPREDDIYYVDSEKGSASIAIQPKGGAGEMVEVTWSWDFSAADWQEQFAALGAANTDITNWNLTYDNLTIFSTAKSKYNTTFFQWGGKGSLTDRYLKFTAPEQGTLKVWASNTGSSEDLTRMVTVNQNGEETSIAGGVPSNGAPAECEFSVMAGDVYIYATGNALRFYKVEFTFTTGGKQVIEKDWNFSAADWQEQFAALGGANTDITNWNLTYDDITIVSTAKSKYNTTFFQWGGKGSLTDRYIKYTAPEQGTIKVYASNTGSSEDLTRMVTVNQNGEETSVAGGVPSNGDPAECEFSVMAGDVYIYCTGNALRFYRITYTNQ